MKSEGLPFLVVQGGWLWIVLVVVRSALVFVAGCRGASPTNVTKQGKGSSAITSGPQTPPSAKPSARDEILVLPTKTDTGGEVIAVGEPRMQLAKEDALGTLAISASAGIAVAEDAGDVVMWDLSTGVVTRQIAPLPDAGRWTTTFVLSPKGDRIASTSGSTTRVFDRPFSAASMKMPCSTVDAISSDGKLVICHGPLQVWNVVDRKLVARAPGPPSGPIEGVAFSANNQAVFWATQHELVKWELQAGTATTIFKAADEIEGIAFASGGGQVFISTRTVGSYKFSGVVLDLGSAQTTPVRGSYKAAISPDGSRLVSSDVGSVNLYEVATGKVLWTTHESRHVQRIAFGEDPNVFGYVADRSLVIVDVPKGVRSYPVPARFAGWVNDSASAVETAGRLEQVSLGDRSRHLIDKVAANPTPSNAPPWASWIGSADLAAEPSARHDAPADARADAPCMPKLRVWTSIGGEKSLTMKCSANAYDPGWELGGTTVLAVGAKRATIFDATTGKPRVTLDVDKPWIDKSSFARSFTAMTVSPTGNYVALVSVGPELPRQGDADPREDAFHISEEHDRIECESEMGECKQQYMLTVYSLAGTPSQAWRAPVSQPTSLAFDRAGARLIVGTDDGEVEVFAATTAGDPHVERLHRGPVVRIAPGPGDQWVFTEDAAGQQRVWRLPP